MTTNNSINSRGGTTTQVLHGNASGSPTYSAVSLTADVTGVLPNANTSATNANTASTIVARDGSGNFSAGTITASLTGNADTVTNGVVTTGSYSDPAWITSLSGSKITGLSCGNSFATVSTSTANLTAGAFTWATYSSGQCTLTLPNAPTDGTVCIVQGVNGISSPSGWKVVAQGSDKIQYGSSVSASAGNITSTSGSSTDGATFIYNHASSVWVVPNVGLNFTVT
jgi:trimeric autotransporter adhesin